MLIPSFAAVSTYGSVSTLDIDGTELSIAAAELGIELEPHVVEQATRRGLSGESYCKVLGSFIIGVTVFVIIALILFLLITEIDFLQSVEAIRFLKL